MTLPGQRTRAVISTREFLVRLTSPYNGGIKGVKKEVREEARRLLRHFPSGVELAVPGMFDVQEIERWLKESGY